MFIQFAEANGTTTTLKSQVYGILFLKMKTFGK